MILRKPTYRRMEEADVEAVFQVRTSTIENAITRDELKEYYDITPDSVAASLRRKAGGWLCEIRGEIVGFCMGDRSNGEVTVLAVLPDLEGRGIGKTLLAYVRDWLYAAGHEQIWLMSNPDPSVRAHGFYRSLGWQPTGRIVEDDEVLVLLREPGWKVDA